MTKKKQIVILGCVFVCLAAIYAASNIYISHKTEDDGKEYSVTDMLPSDIVRIRYSNSDRTIEFTKGVKIWYYSDDKTLEVDQDYIDELLQSLSDITSSKKIADPDSIADYGLDKPTYTITLTTDDEQVTVIEIGNMTATFGYYVTADGGDTIYTIDSSLMDSLRFEKSSFEAAEEDDTEESEESGDSE
ncbi:MAG: DUF4340 domain-containing protein [Lentihominibacter sp.]